MQEKDEREGGFRHGMKKKSNYQEHSGVLPEHFEIFLVMKVDLSRH